MSLTLDIPLEVENELREVAQKHGRELGAYIVEAALEQTRREKQELRARMEALQELTSINEELGLYDWELDVNNRAA